MYYTPQKEPLLTFNYNYSDFEASQLHEIPYRNPHISNVRPDVAILKFNSPFNSEVVPVCLPNNPPKPSLNCLGSGWSNSKPISVFQTENEQKEKSSQGL